MAPTENRAWQDGPEIYLVGCGIPGLGARGLVNLCVWDLEKTAKMETKDRKGKGIVKEKHGKGH